MNKKTYKIIVIVSTVIAVIGLISFVGGIRPVNIGVFIFPELIALWAFCKYKKA